MNYISFKNFSFNRELNRFNLNYNSDAAMNRLAHVLTGKNPNPLYHDIRNGGELRNVYGNIIRQKDSDEMMNDLISRWDIMCKRVQNGTLHPNALNVLNNVIFTDQYGNDIVAYLNQKRSRINTETNPATLQLRNVMDKYHEIDGHLNPNLRTYVSKDLPLKKQIEQNGSHATAKLQRLEACTDLYGIQAHNNWVDKKGMPKRFYWSPINFITYRNQIEYQKKLQRQRYLSQFDKNTPAYNEAVKKIKSQLPLNARDPFGFDDYMKSDKEHQLSNTEPHLESVLLQAQKYNYTADDMLENVKHLPVE